MKNKSKLNLSNINFISFKHIRYENEGGIPGIFESKREIEIRPHSQGKKGYSVTLYRLKGTHPIFGDNIQLGEKQMEIIESNEEKTILKGYDNYSKIIMNLPFMKYFKFSNFGLSIIHPNSKIEKIIIHLHDRNIDIEYF